MCLYDLQKAFDSLTIEYPVDNGIVIITHLEIYTFFYFGVILGYD